MLAGGNSIFRDLVACWRGDASASSACADDGALANLKQELLCHARNLVELIMTNGISRASRLSSNFSKRPRPLQLLSRKNKAALKAKTIHSRDRLLAAVSKPCHSLGSVWAWGSMAMRILGIKNNNFRIKKTNQKTTRMRA
jgi:hypothetical protein